MKKNIPTYLLLAMTLITTHSILMPMKYNWNPNQGTTQVGFSLRNNSDYLIQFQIYNESAGMYHRHVLEIEPNGEYNIQLNTVVPTKLKIYYCPEDKLSACTALELPIANSVETSFPTGKTIYISWDGRELVAQSEGPIPYATRAGYSLTNNVQKTDYTLTETKSSHTIYPKEQGRDPWDEVFPNVKEYKNSLRIGGMYSDDVEFKLILGLVGGMPTNKEINQAWQAISARWNPDDHPDEPNFARAVMKIINNARNSLFSPIINQFQESIPTNRPLP